MVKVRSRGRLPHWEHEGAIYFVTFRLADSLPESARRRISFERHDIIQTARAMGRSLSPSEKSRLIQLSRKKIEAQIDGGAGSCLLAQPAIAKIVSDCLKHFDGTRYRLFAWSVMPNHVHVLFQPLGIHDLAHVLQAWKSYSAKAINRIARSCGELWESEYFDHIVRNQREFERISRYILANPQKAGLTHWPWVAARSPGR